MSMWIRNVFSRISSSYCICPSSKYVSNIPNRGNVNYQLFNLRAQTMLKVAVRKSLHVNSYCSIKNATKICSQTAWSSFRCYGTKKHKYASYSTFSSRRRIPREVSILLLLGVTGGVVYGLNKKYENDKFDKKMDEIDKIIKKAQTSDIQETQKEMAIKLYKEALRMVKIQIDSEQSQRRMSTLTTTFVFIIDQLANLMHGLGKLSDAEDYYKQTLQALLAHGTSQDDDSVIEISLKLASIYAEENRHELAENGYTWCVENARKKVNVTEKLNLNSSALLGICLESFGKYLLSRNHPSKAISLFSEALVISKNIFGENHVQVVLLLNNLGVAYFEAGNLESSKTFFSEAISLSTDENHEDLWSFHLNLANVLAQTGEIEEARKEYKQSMQLCRSETIRHDIKEQFLKLP